ncbi:MAG: tRNA (N(6)-L-threonylcarbamoyladenosine(37)-C(2))-methylthiotransferase MtaB [Clostridiales bacterium]|nr:tRNA (N(6)-L-threonylcarbamoyladenosine(37)-C(2))-methylthiotransferase MtaB [Clostridiales bacterium]
MKLGINEKVAFCTLGCKVNQYDTQAMQEEFLLAGYEVAEFDDFADVYVINTCTVTNMGDRKSRQMIHRASKLNPEAVIAVVGCYAQRAPKEIIDIPGVDLVLGTRDRVKIVEYIRLVKESGKPVNKVQDIMDSKVFEEMPITTYFDKTRVSLKIQEGCDRYCSYCIIPYTRGPIRSRKPRDVIEQVHSLVDSGLQEFVLTGIHLASYGKDLNGESLLSLIKELDAIEGLKRIRLGSLEPTFLDDNFVHAARDIPKLCRHYHLSLQSGSDLTLRRMNRRYNTAQYRETVERLRKHIPLVAITTDIMVGFPGETQEEFEDTLKFTRDIGFSRIHVFKYSVREGTAAARYRDQVPGKIKENRSRQLISIGKDMEIAYMKSLTGRVESVLFEEECKDKQGWYEGYTDHYVRVAVPGGSVLYGSIKPVLLEEINNGKILGSFLTP